MNTSLRDLLACLSRHQVRATYSAVAEVLGVTVKALLAELGSPQVGNSWVVSQQTGLPVGYPAQEIHPGLPRSPLIANGAALRVFLAESSDLPPSPGATVSQSPQRR